jgi:hypothetical protein
MGSTIKIKLVQHAFQEGSCKVVTKLVILELKLASYF